MSTPPTGAACSSRLATFTASPITLSSPVGARPTPTSAGPGVHPDAHREAVAGLGAEVGQRRLQPERGPDRAFGVVLAGDVGAPDGHQRVADVLVDPAAVLHDDRVEPRPQRVHEVHHELGVAGLRHRGEPAHVGEQDRDLAAPALGRRPELGLERGDRGVDHVVGHGAAELLLGLDRAAELVGIGHGGARFSHDSPAAVPGGVGERRLRPVLRSLGTRPSVPVAA